MAKATIRLKISRIFEIEHEQTDEAHLIDWIAEEGILDDEFLTECHNEFEIQDATYEEEEEEED